MIKLPISLKRGFSLIEVLVFVTIVGLFFISAVAVVSVIVRNMKVNEHKIIGTRYAEEVVEWLRSEKETDWNTFTSRIPTSDTVFCMNTLSWSGGTECDYELDSLYKRTATLKSLQTDDGYKYEVNVNVIVEWDEVGKTYEIPVNTTFSIWEQ